MLAEEHTPVQLVSGYQRGPQESREAGTRRTRQVWDDLALLVTSTAALLPGLCQPTRCCHFWGTTIVPMTDNVKVHLTDNA